MLIQVRRFIWLAPWAVLVLSFVMAFPSKGRAAGSHLYVMLGLGGMSPGLSDFGARIGHRGIPTTVGSYLEWPAFADEAIRNYKNGRVRSIMIVGHSLGGSAARAMAAELAEANVPVRLLITLDPVGASGVSRNVRHEVNIMPGTGEDHFSMIDAHRAELDGYVLGGHVPHPARAREKAPENNFGYGSNY